MLLHQQLHPLLLPEILARVCLAIPAWDSTSFTTDNTDCHTHSSLPHSAIYRFTPKTLIAASKVCRTWYSIFYPALWTIYDGYAMSPRSLIRQASGSGSDSETSTHQKQLCVPDALVLAHSTHIRILLNDSRRLFDRRRFECPFLTDLTLYGASPGYVHLVTTHGPQLKRLEWHGSIPFSGMSQDLELGCMEVLTAVEELVLVQWDVSAKEVCSGDNEEEQGDVENGCNSNNGVGKSNRRRGLIEVLAQTCSKTLRRLTLQHIQGLDDLPSDFALDLSGSTTALYGGNNDNGRRGGLVLDQLEQLFIDAEWVENKALMHFLIGQTPTHSLGSSPLLSPPSTPTVITNFFPRLKRLTLGARLQEEPEMIAFLEGLLPLVHPRLVRDGSSANTSPSIIYQVVVK